MASWSLAAFRQSHMAHRQCLAGSLAQAVFASAPSTLSQFGQLRRATFDRPYRYDTEHFVHGLWDMLTGHHGRCA